MADTIHEAATMVMNGVKELREECAKLRGLRDVQEDNLRRLEAENAVFKEQIKDLSAKLDFFQGFSIELTTRIDCIQAACEEAVQRSKEGAFAPRTIKPPADQISTPMTEEKPLKFLRRDVNHG